MPISSNQKLQYRAWGSKYIQVFSIYTNTWVFAMELTNQTAKDAYLGYLKR